MSWLGLANVAAAGAVSAAINSLWLGLLLGMLAWVMLRVLPRSNAATRYAIWFTALLLTLVTPALLLIPHATEMAVSPAPASGTPWSVPVTVPWPSYAVLAWALIAFVLLARVAWSLAHIHGLKRRATEIGVRGRIRLLMSNEIHVPMAAGFLRRAVVFPEPVLSELSAEEFEQVLCHETAHLRRWDDWTQLAQAVVQAILFFNPALYWITRRLKIEREMACDNWVVSATGEARPYAACLARLHELTHCASAPQLAPGATTRRRRQISARVEALLEPGRNATPYFSRSGWMAAGALVSAALVVAAKTTPPVGVQALPVARMALAQLSPPPAPPISLVPRRVAPARPRLLARRMPLAKTMPSAAVVDMPVVLVRAWKVEVTPTYFVITMVFFEPPPVRATSGT